MSWGIAFRVRQYIKSSLWKSSLWLVALVGGLVGLALAELGLQLEARDALPEVWHYSPCARTADAQGIGGPTVSQQPTSVVTSPVSR